MLKYNEEERYSAEKCLDHQWFKEIIEKKEESIFRKIVKTKNKPRNYSNLQYGILLYISEYLTPHNVMEDIAKVFRYLDKNHTGHITQNDIVNTCKNLNIPEENYEH